MGFTELEAAGKKALEQFPVVKRSAKRVYQVASVVTNREKVKAEGDITRVSPNDNYEYFYGYYDKSPWDITDRYMICVRVKQAYKSVAPAEPGIVCLIDTQNKNKLIKIGTTHSWNVQQSCMAQWLGPDFKSRIIYNDYREGHYCSVIYNVAEMAEERVFPLPVYDVAKDGSFALSLDFNRLHRMRPGYGYSNQPDRSKGLLCPDKTCIWKLDLSTGKVEKLFKYTDFAAFEPDETMNGAEHKVNHLMISPNGKRFMVLHRWFDKGRKHTRLVTVNVDKTEMYNLSDDVFVSHCYWKNDEEILSFLRKKETGDHYYLMKDKTQEYKLFWPELNTDGHCSYSPDGKFIITDTYPNRKRIASVYLCTEEDNRSRRIARVFSPFKYDNDCRCDLHPRWNHTGDKVCIDSVHEKKRGLYVIDIKNINNGNKTTVNGPLVSIVVPCYNAENYILETLNSIESQIYKSIEVLCIDDGSEDSTWDKLTEWSKSTMLKHKIIRQKNKGVSSARNKGIELATGKYLMFLDADDVYREDMVSSLVYAVNEKGTDTAYCLLKRKKELVFSYTRNISLKMQTQSEAMHNLLYRMSEISFDCYIYDMDLIRKLDLKFQQNAKYGEDREFNWKYLTNCDNIAFIDNSLYYYRVNDASATKKRPTWDKTDLLEAVKRIEEYLMEHECSFYHEFQSYMLSRATWTVAKTFALGKQKELFKRLIKTYDVKTHMKAMAKDRNKLVSFSSRLYLIAPMLFYKVISKSGDIKKF